MLLCVFHRGEEGMAVQLNYLTPHTEEYHDYEDLEKYNEIRDILPKIPPGPAAQSSLPATSGDDYEFTTCPAYVPITSQGQSSVPFVDGNSGTEETQIQYEEAVVVA